jgi:hypothetical protein
VSADLQLDPTVLRSCAAAVEWLLRALQVTGLDPVDLAALARVPGGPALVAEHDRLMGAAERVGRELADLVAALHAVADGVESAERDAVRSVGAVDR